MDENLILESLKQESEKFKADSKPYKGIEKLVYSIHSAPELREWVTLESIPLIPYITNENRDSIMVFLSVSVKNDTFMNILPPWGVLIYSYPELKLLKKLNLKGKLKADYTLSSDAILTPSLSPNVEKSLNEGVLPDMPKDLKRAYMEAAKAIEDYDSNFNLQKTALASDLSVTPLLDETKALIDESEAQIPTIKLKNTLGFLRDPYFTIGVVGEFSTGKSSLINKLVDADIVPVSTLPTTTLITKIIYGEKPALVYYKADGTMESREFDLGSFDDLNAFDEKEDPEGAVRIDYPYTWLKDYNIQFIDSPGTSDIVSRRAEKTTDVISICDAIIVVVSAVMPLSLTEKAFIDQHILARKVPKVVVAVSKLDLVAPEQRESVLTYIKNKLQTWSNNIEMLVINEAEDLPENSSFLPVCGRANILSFLEEWTMDKQHKILRGISVACELRDSVSLVKDSLNARLAAAKLSSEEREKARKAFEEKTEHLRLDWEDLRLEMDKRSVTCSRWINDRVYERRGEIIEKLKFELSHVSNPKSWWEKDMPYRLKQELGYILRNLEDTLTNMYLKDVHWLYEEVKRRFSNDLMLYKDNSFTEAQEPILKPSGNELTDINSFRTFTRIGAGAATILGYTLFGPLGIVFSISGGIVSEILLNKNISKQSQRLDTAIDGVVDDVFKKVLAVTSERIAAAYRNALNEITSKEYEWVAVQKSALNNDNTDVSADNIKALIEKSDILLNKINQFMGGLKND